LKKISSYESFNEGRIKFGSVDGFDQLTTNQQHVVLLLKGLFSYNGHMSMEMEPVGNELKITIGRKEHDWNGPADAETAKIINGLLEYHDTDIKIEKGSRTIFVK
jgi:hypothetical protein